MQRRPKWDELGIVILSWMFRIVIMILMDKKVWTVAANNKLLETDIFLAFTGDLMFEDTCEVNVTGQSKVHFLTACLSSTVWTVVTPGESPTNAIDMESVPEPTPLVSGCKTWNSQKAGYVSSKQLKIEYAYVPKKNVKETASVERKLLCSLNFYAAKAQNLNHRDQSQKHCLNCHHLVVKRRQTLPHPVQVAAILKETVNQVNQKL